MVEFALVAPLFFLFVFLIAEGALFINAQLTLDNSTREAARALAVCGANRGAFLYNDPRHPYTSCTAAAVSILQGNLGILNPRGPSPQVTVAGGYGSGGSMTVSFTYAFYAPAQLGLAGPSLLMTSTAPIIGQQ